MENISCDVVVFDSILKRLGNEEKVDSEQNIRYIEQAVSLYRGDYMGKPGWEWAETSREEYTQQYVMLLRRVSHYYMKCKIYQTAITYMEKIIKVNPFLEEVHILLMKAQAAIGDRQAVICQYEKLQKLFIDELGIEPDVSIKKIYYELLK